MTNIIVAIAENGVIGKDNSLLWHISDDLKRFKQITENHTVIMGRKTYFSLPFRPLKNRRNIVISSSVQQIEGAEVVKSVEEAFALCNDESEVFVIGGESIYRQTIDLADKLYITKVFKTFDGDTFFPEISENSWKITDETAVFYDEKADLEYQFLVYNRLAHR
ncbi:MAG: dihydrofolate reductase [Prevotellaceae bacterium]|jgi:dihydrofolate reductase|nr:dihydrofolate reductase [Prevotellaceae bacterium]